MSFRDRSEAGDRLAEALTIYKGADPVVFALPRGGVPVAEPVARALEAPLDIVLVRKIGVPHRPELAMGAVAAIGAPMFVRNEDILAELAIDDETFDAASARAVAEIERRRRLYLGGRPAPNLRGRTAIVVDDGVATGATTRAALRAVRALGPSKIVLAIPVAPPETLAFLKGDADDIVCLETPDDFCAVGAYYRDFRQIDDDEVIELLKRASAARR